MTEFTTDWSASIAHWPAMFDELGLAGQPGLRFLEIGCFEGRTTLWLLEHVLTHPGSVITVVDPFALDGQRGRFNRNLNTYIDAGKVRVWPYDSAAALRHVRALGGPFDFVYVDGSHLACDVLADAVLAWPLVKAGGAVVFDDYVGLAQPHPWQRPEIAVDAFVACYGPQLEGGRVGADQYLVRKLGGAACDRVT